MPRIQRSTYSQLTLIDQFDKLAGRDQQLVYGIKNGIGNIKYFRVNARFSETKNKKEIDETFGQILYWMAFLGWKKSRHLVEYKGAQLEEFLKLTRERTDISVTESLTVETLREYYWNAHKRFKAHCMAFKDILVEERGIVKRILDNFDKLHTLAE